MINDTNLSNTTDNSQITEPYLRAQQRLNQQIQQAGPASATETSELLHALLNQQLELEEQRNERLKERTKELNCLYSIRREMVLNLSVDELCNRIVVHLAKAVRFPELAITIIDLNDQRFTSKKYVQTPVHALETPIYINKKVCGKIQILYIEEQSFLLPEEQELLNTIAADLQLWLERVQTESALKASLSKVRLIEDALDAHSIVAITNRQGIITHVNNKFCSIAKYSREELLGQDHRLINSGFHPQEFMRHLWKTIAKGNIWKGEIKNKAKDGSYYWVDTTIIPFFDDKEKPFQYIAIRTEITERKQLELLMAQRVEELARSNDELAQFAYVASHDLQEPLRAVTSCVQLLKKRYESKIDDQADKFISHAVAGVERMQKLINDLLTYSRIDTHDSIESVNCEEILANVLNNLAIKINENNAVITHDPLPSVSVIKFQLFQLFENLIGNAIKFHRIDDKPVIHISAAQKSNEWVFSITDNGIGIEQEYFSRIFLVFQRLHTRSEYSGTGIGLAICKKIIKSHGGHIWVKSQIGQGTIFYFSIPKK